MHGPFWPPPFGGLKAIGIEVEHMVGFECRCGHRHGGAQWPPFPQSVECDDAPVAAVLPEVREGGRVGCS